MAPHNEWGHISLWTFTIQDICIIRYRLTLHPHKYRHIREKIEKQNNTHKYTNTHTHMQGRHQTKRHRQRRRHM